jgi:hypothetical protein
MSHEEQSRDGDRENDTQHKSAEESPELRQYSPTPTPGQAEGSEETIREALENQETQKR